MIQYHHSNSTLYMQKIKIYKLKLCYLHLETLLSECITMEKTPNSHKTNVVKKGIDLYIYTYNVYK